MTQRNARVLLHVTAKNKTHLTTTMIQLVAAVNRHLLLQLG